MIELRGKYNNCKVFTDLIDESAISQIIGMLNQESMSGLQVRVMPDTHSGASSVIGMTMTLKDKVVPAIVGVDIGCGMHVVKLKEKRIDLPALDSVIRKYVPSGFSIHEDAVASSNVDNLLAKGMDINKAFKSLGTLGGGNHFIEVDKGEDGSLYLVIHTGSRHLGIEVCNYYQELGYNRIMENAAGGSLKEKSEELVQMLKSQGRQKEISSKLEVLRKNYKSMEPRIQKDLAYVEGRDFADYIHDMKLTQEHASINRQTIVRTILKHAKLHAEDEFETVHNYIDTDAMILRKGAVSAKDGERLIIPLNMRDGSLICMGKGNPDWNFSAPHGAGRLMSRAQAKNSISMEDFKNSMDGIFTTCVDRSTIDESPFAYKPWESIAENIEDSVDIKERIIPIYNFKASETS